jgi:MoaA/NifB/PqqE/SkfB family radical SAM enzyme
MDARDRTRVHALDGAVLLFQPSSGTSIRIETEATADVRRRAPRVVLFSLSHACNLDCGFCSRDASERARWSEEDAFRTLEALWRAGTLEVSFGGGEPLVHTGFIELLERLHAQTTLALHFTTNGTRVDATLAERLAPLVGEVRLSAYEDQGWESALRMLVSAGVRVGINVVATPDGLSRLPSLMHRAAAAGACDVAVLRYVGDDPSLQADPCDLSMLEQAIVAAPLPVRVSNCLLDTMPNVPRLFPGLTVAGRGGLVQDCGAGRDFVVIDPDAGVRSCSFHADRVDLGDVDAWLERYRGTSELAPAPRRGCARPITTERPVSRGAFAYRSFASNNSGDTLLVARFESVDDASAFASSLPDAGGEDTWDAFFREQGVSRGDRDLDA